MRCAINFPTSKSSFHVLFVKRCQCADGLLLARMERFKLSSGRFWISTLRIPGWIFPQNWRSHPDVQDLSPLTSLRMFHTLWSLLSDYSLRLIYLDLPLLYVHRSNKFLWTWQWINPWSYHLFSLFVFLFSLGEEILDYVSRGHFAKTTELLISVSRVGGY